MSMPVTIAEFGRALRAALAETVGGTFTTEDLSQRSGISKPMLQQILTGKRLPSGNSFQRLALAIDLPLRQRNDLLQLLAAAKAAQEARAEFPDAPSSKVRGNRTSQPVPQFGQPDPIRVSNPEELTQALRAVHVWAGSPSLRKLEARSAGRLRRSSVSDMLRNPTLPDYDRFIAFLRACGIDGPHLEVWVFTWRRLTAMEKPEIASWMPGIWSRTT